MKEAGTRDQLAEVDLRERRLPLSPEEAVRKPVKEEEGNDSIVLEKKYNGKMGLNHFSPIGLLSTNSNSCI
jgi:hypothetical protein